LPTTIEQPVQAEVVKPATRLLAPSSLLARNAVLNFITEGWTFVVLVLAMPKLVAFWGETSFGLFSLAWVVIGYLSFLDIGVNRAATKFISEHLADHDHDAVRGLVRTSFLANLTFGLAGGLLVLLASPYLVHSVFKISGALQREARLVFFAVALAVPMLLVQGVFRAVLSSYQRFGWINSVNAVTMTVQWGSAIWLAWRGHGVAVVVLATVITRLLGTLACGVLLYRLLPNLRLWGTASLSGLAKLLKFGTWVSISQVISPLLVYLDRILIASFVSLGAVTLYTVPFEAMTRLRIVPSSLVNTLYPAFSERGIGEDRSRLRELYEGSVRYLLILTLPLVIVLIVLGPDLLSIWMGRPFASQASGALQILGVGVLLNCMATIPYNLLQAVGRPDLTGKFHLWELPPYVLMCCVLIPRWGITGAALASTVRFAGDSALLFWAAGKYCRCQLRTCWNGIFWWICLLNAGLSTVLVLIHFSISSVFLRIALGLLSLGVHMVAALALATRQRQELRVADVMNLFLKQPAN